MVRNHLKRYAAPGFWNIRTKERTYIVRPTPGAHAISTSVPVKVAICDTLGLVKSAREASFVLNQGDVVVDGRKVKDSGFPVGPMDILSIPKLKQNFRLVTSKKGLEFVPIEEKDAKQKLCRINGKRTVKGGKIQLELHDGRNIILKDGSAYHVGDSLLLEMPGQKIVEHIPLKEGNLILVTGGSHVGQVVKLLDVRHQVMKPNVAVLAGKVRFETILDYVMPVGVEEPVINLGG